MIDLLLFLLYSLTNPTKTREAWRRCRSLYLFCCFSSVRLQPKHRSLLVRVDWRCKTQDYVDSSRWSQRLRLSHYPSDAETLQKPLSISASSKKSFTGSRLRLIIFYIYPRSSRSFVVHLTHFLSVPLSIQYDTDFAPLVIGPLFF